MAVRKNRLNRFFAGLIIMLLIGIVGVSIYFQFIIDDMNSENEFLADQLHMTAQELYQTLDQLERLNTTAQDLNSNLESYTTEFQEVYHSCEEERDAVTGKLTSTQAELTKTKNRLDTANDNLKDARLSLARLNSNFVSMEERIDDLESDIVGASRNSNNIDDLADDSGSSAQVSELQAYIDDIADENNDLKDDIDSARAESGKLRSDLAELEDRIDETLISLTE